MEYILTISYQTEDGQQASFSINDVKEVISDEDVKALCTAMVSGKLIEKSGSLIAAVKSAKHIGKTVKEIKLA